jgi:SAM-dependent methyltransferase
MEPERRPQFAYSEQMAAMLDEEKRRLKAGKILAVLEHALGRQDLSGLIALDVGCSAGYIIDELANSGAIAHGVDIDEGGVERAKSRFGHHVTFHVADAEHLPFADGSVDVVIFNHIYEHVVDPAKVVQEIYRVLAEGGIGYFGLANRLGLIEPHYKLPFLSWLSPRLSDGYVRLTRRADNYYERLRSRRSLKQLFSAFDAWDYTMPVLADPALFSGKDVVPSVVSHLPIFMYRAFMPLIPTYIWVGFKRPTTPAGASGRVKPARVR